MLFVKHHYRQNSNIHLSETRRLTAIFNNNVRSHGLNNNTKKTWTDVFTGANRFDIIKNDLINHNSEVRKSWKSISYNEQESVVEVYANYEEKALKIQHVNKDTSIKEKVYFSSLDQQVNAQEDNFVKIMGDSELPTNQLDQFFPGETFTSFCELLDSICG